MKYFLSVILFCSALPASTFHVNTEGSDSNDGSENRPFQTIQKAADIAQPGDTIIVFPGIYRERISPARGGKLNQPIKYISSTPHGAIVRGSNPWKPQWQKLADRIYKGKLTDDMFKDMSMKDGPNPFKIPFSSTPYGRDGKPEFDRKYPQSNPDLSYNLGQVFVDDECYTQEPIESKMKSTPKSWRYENGEIFINFPDDSPNKHQVEITTQRRLFAPHQRQLEYIIIEGFVFERCSNQYPTNFWQSEYPEWQQAGMVGTRSGRYWTIKNNIIRFASAVGIDLGNEGDNMSDLEKGENGQAAGSKGHHVENNIISDNGAAGTASYLGTHLVIRNNSVERNNRMKFTGKKRWESAGIKLHGPSFSIVEGNLVRNNYGTWGIWFDEGAGKETRVVGNICVNHGVGIDFEVGSAAKAVVEKNILINNDTGIRTRESGGLNIQKNLILGSKVCGIQFSLDRKRDGKWSAAHCNLYQNIIISKQGLLLKLTAPDQLRSEDKKLDNNFYDAGPSEKRFCFDPGEPINFNEWKKSWKGYNGEINSDTNSQLINGCSFQFDESKLTLELTLSFDPQEKSLPGLKKGTQKVVLRQ